jgi:hypothetical protein
MLAKALEVEIVPPRADRGQVYCIYIAMCCEGEAVATSFRAPLEYSGCGIRASRSYGCSTFFTASDWVSGLTAIWGCTQQFEPSRSV